MAFTGIVSMLFWLDFRGAPVTKLGRQNTFQGGVCRVNVPDIEEG
jgi:hypothetical protein